MIALIPFHKCFQHLAEMQFSSCCKVSGTRFFSFYSNLGRSHFRYCPVQGKGSIACKLCSQNEDYFITEGVNQANFSTSGLNSGFYVIRITGTDNALLFSGKVVK